VALLLLPWLARGLPAAGRRAVGLLWILTLLPVVIVGATQGKFATRYLLFAAPLLAMLLAVALGLALTLRAGPRAGWVLGGGALLVALAVLPEAGPPAALRTVLLPVDSRLDPWMSPSATRSYLLDLETPCRWVEERRAEGDLVVATHRSLPSAFLGGVDAWFSRPKPSVMRRDRGGGLRNLLTGEPVLVEPSEVLELCEEARLFVVVDLPQLHSRKQVRRLRRELLSRTGKPAYATPSGLTEVFLLERGCAPLGGESGAAAAGGG
jgi:hypothetical protein